MGKASRFLPSFGRFDKCWGYSRYFPLAPPTDRHHRAQGLFGAKITRRQPRGDHFAKTRASSTPRRSAIKVRVACPKGSIRAVTDHLSVVNQPIPSPMSLQESDDSSGIVSRLSVPGLRNCFAKRVRSMYYLRLDPSLDRGTDGRMDAS